MSYLIMCWRTWWGGGEYWWEGSEVTLLTTQETSSPHMSVFAMVDMIMQGEQGRVLNNILA